MSKRELDIQLYRLSQQVKKSEAQISSLEVEFAKKIKIARDVIADAREMEEKISEAADRFKEACEKEAQRAERRLLEELKVEKEARESALSLSPEIDLVSLSKAKTLAIFDTIIFAISNWSTDGQAAPDCELACQSILFPAVYEQVMKQNKDYYITSVPPVALELVRRGREFIKYIRDNCEASLVTQTAWDAYAPLIQQWWINDALPLLYGARDPAWDDLTPLSLVEMTEWRDMPASRALHFPLIFDGAELVKEHGDQIREFTKLPEFNKQQVSTRINP